MSDQPKAQKAQKAPKAPRKRLPPDTERKPATEIPLPPSGSAVDLQAMRNVQQAVREQELQWVHDAWMDATTNRQFSEMLGRRIKTQAPALYRRLREQAG